MKSDRFCFVWPLSNGEDGGEGGKDEGDSNNETKGPTDWLTFIAHARPIWGGDSCRPPVTSVSAIDVKFH